MLRASCCHEALAPGLGREPRATLVVTRAGDRILVRPDEYIATIGEMDVKEFAGAATQVVNL